ncbi:unnamed protein product [Clonostachys rosea]|uniref:PPPDE domain-containing protein n=1 Tax=Bionectria ochroleuca TaxID=29856 RepID=A0ABY6V1B5_BIOOC|nr:unnamed protein product [Clonostachys rosea]
MTDNWRSQYHGYTDKSPEEIKTISDNLVQRQIDNQVGYNIPFNNCAHFAQTFADKITEGSAVSNPDTSYSSDAVFTRRAQYNTIAGAEALARGNAEEAKRLAKTPNWSEDVSNRVDAGIVEYRDQWQPDWYVRPNTPPAAMGTAYGDSVTGTSATDSTREEPFDDVTNPPW